MLFVRVSRLLTWEQDAFAYAESYDESAARYRGLRSGAQVNVTADDSGLLVRPEVARRQIDQETAPPVPVGRYRRWRFHPDRGRFRPSLIHPGRCQPGQTKRYHGTVVLDSGAGRTRCRQNRG